MAYLTNLDGNVKLEFDFLSDFPDALDIADSKFEKWVPYVLILSTSERTIAITKEMQAFLTAYEVEKIYNGMRNLLYNSTQSSNNIFKHYSNESFFEISIEYIEVDECFSVELWFIAAEAPEGNIDGYDIGYRFVVDKKEMELFLTECYKRFRDVYSNI